jgi:hypothetical protein
MGVKYISFEVQIHGIDIKDDNWVKFLQGWMKTCVEACLRKKEIKHHYNFRNEFDSDIEVKTLEYAGEFENE